MMMIIIISVTVMHQTETNVSDTNNTCIGKYIMLHITATMGSFKTDPTSIYY